MRESVIEAYLIERVKALGGEVRKVKWVGRRGAPDRLVMLPTSGQGDLFREGEYFYYNGISYIVKRPRTLWVELKAPGEKPESHQVREHERMRAMGQHVEIVDSIARVDEVLA